MLPMELEGGFPKTLTLRKRVYHSDNAWLGGLVDCVEMFGAFHAAVYAEVDQTLLI